MSGDVGERGRVEEPANDPPLDQRRLGVMAAVGGIAWIIGVAMALILPPDEYGDHGRPFAVIGLAIGASLIGIALGQLGTRPGSRSAGGPATLSRSRASLLA